MREFVRPRHFVNTHVCVQCTLQSAAYTRKDASASAATRLPGVIFCLRIQVGVAHLACVDVRIRRSWTGTSSRSRYLLARRNRCCTVLCKPLYIWNARVLRLMANHLLCAGSDEIRFGQYESGLHVSCPQHAPCRAVPCTTGPTKSSQDHRSRYTCGCSWLCGGMQALCPDYSALCTARLWTGHRNF